MWLSLLRRFWPFLALIFIGVMVKIFVDNYNEAQQEVGKANVIITTQGKVLEDAIQANDASNDVADPTQHTKYCQCLRTTRTSGTCERYLPISAQNNSKPASMCEAR